MRFASLFAILILLFVSSPAAATFESAVNGANGVVTAVFDPVYGLVTGEIPGMEGEYTSRDQYKVNLPFGSISPLANNIVNHLAAAGLGVMVSYMRVVTGVVDMATSPFSKIPPISPPPSVVVFSVTPTGGK